jgi:hypothetical protein
VSSWEKTSRACAASSLAAEGYSLPKIPKVGRVCLDPTHGAKKIVELDDGTFQINLYVPPAWSLVPVQEELLAEDLMPTLEAQAPYIHKYMRHITSCNDVMAKRLLLWTLAQIRHHEGRVRTAWILRGVQGSGKSMFITEIVRRLLLMGRVGDSRSYVTAKSIQNMKEQYNSWIVENLFCIVDEADIMKVPYAERRDLYNKLKMYITSPFVTVRSMYKDQTDGTPRAAFFFTSNEYQLFEIEESDRRFHVTDFVSTKVTDALGFESEGAFMEAIVSEIPTLAAILHRVKLTVEDMREIDVPELTLEKRVLTESSRSVPAQFCHALKTANAAEIWELVSDHIYADQEVAESTAARVVIATIATIARAGGGEFHLPHDVVNKMYALATLNGRFPPKAVTVLREARLLTNSGSGFDRINAGYHPAILEVTGLTNAARGLRIPTEWTSEDSFAELLSDKFISGWIRDAIKREASAALKSKAKIDAMADSDVVSG